MGFIAALNNAEGKYINMKLLLLTVFAAVALADESTEEATPAVASVAVYPHQLHWPGYYGTGFSSQCWGCRGKRSAEAEPEAKAGPFYGYHPFGYYGLPLVHVTPDLTLAGKDEGVAAHPNEGTSWTQRSAQGAYAGLAWGRRRRSAEPEAKADPGLLYPYAYHLPVYHAIVPVAPAVAPIAGEGVAAHPNLGTSKVSPTTWGFPERKRRSAEPEAKADPGLLYPYGYHLPVYHAIVPVAPAVAPIAGEGVAAHPNLGTSKVSPTTWG